jgi:hypothetical protein
MQSQGGIKGKTRKCPKCGHTAFKIVYGMVFGDAREKSTNVEFAGCVMEIREDGTVAKWSCQNPECRHRW